MQIQLLGGVRVLDDGGEDVDPGPAKCRALLGALVLSPDRSVPVATLVDLLWGDDPPRTAAKTLQTYIARLRRALGHEALVRDGTAYRLELPDDAIDVRRFRQRVTAGDVGGALAEWSGSPLAGLDADGLRPMVDGLVEEWLTTVETDLAAVVESDPASALGRLTELTASHPFREGLWALHMTALYRVGRQADALDAYRRARSHLVEELGVEPGTRLRELEKAILEHDPRLRLAPVDLADVGAAPTGTVAFATAELDRAVASVSVEDHVDQVGQAALDQDGVVVAAIGSSVSAAFHRVSDATAWAEFARDVDASAVRVGVHLGEAEIRSGTYLGAGVEVAGRLAAAAHHGQILLSGAAAAVTTNTALTDLGVARLDDTSPELRVHQLGSTAFPPLRAGRARRSAPPRPLGRLIGRESFVPSILGTLAENRVVTLVGPGGIGKTRLALEVARRHSPTTTWFVELAELTSSAEVTRSVSDALGVSEAQGRPLTEAIADALDRSDGLLVLDNCEHVIDAAGDLVAAIVASGASVTVLCTSREGLGLIGEQLVVVGPLDAETAAVELFVERASAIDRLFKLDSDRSSVEAICRRLDGVPLAIELAAARVRTHSTSELADQLAHSFRLLTGGRRATVERHRTLRATVQWSYDLLSETEATMFRRLSVFAGPFDLAAAEAVVPDGQFASEDVGAVLADLVDRSMIVVEPARADRRYRMLETIRQFGAERLSEHHETDTVAERHADHVLGHVRKLAETLAGPDEVRGAAELVELLPNLRAAIDWAFERRDASRVQSMLRPLATQLFLRRGIGEVSDWAERLIDIAGPDDDESITTALLCLSLHNIITQDVDRFHDVASRRPRPDNALAEFAMRIVEGDSEVVLQSVRAAESAIDKPVDKGLTWLLEIFTAGYLLQCGHLAECAAQIEATIEHLQSDAPPTYLNWALYIAGALADIQGDQGRSEELYRSAVDLRIPPRTNSPNESLTARWTFEAGEHREAFEILRSYVDELLAAGDRNGVGLVSIEFVNMAVSVNRLDLAAQIIGHLRRFGTLRDPESRFAAFVADAVALVDADRDLTTIAEQAAEEAGDQRDALVAIAAGLDELIAESPARSRGR